MKKSLSCRACRMICLGVTLQFASFAFASEIDLPRLPAASPDGQWVTFTWRGDLWKAPGTGGAATRLTSHPADEARSAWSPDGSMIAFESTRDGGRNLYLIDSNGQSLKRVTNTDEALSLSGFGKTPTGETALEFFGTPEYNFFRAARPYFVPLSGGEPIRRHDAFGIGAVPSPDGSRYLFERGGSDWARRGYRGSDDCDVWLYDPKANPDAQFQRLTEHDGNDGWGRWRNDNSFLFLSDRDLATVNVFVQDAKPFAPARRLTGFENADVKDLSVSGDGRRAFFTVWDRLYRLDLDVAGAQPVALSFTAPDDTIDQQEVRALSSAATEVALNPDGKSAAIVAFGDLWIKPIEGKIAARRVTSAIAREHEIAWSPDGETLYFTSDQDGGESIMVASVATTRAEVADTAKVLEPPPAEPVIDAPAPVEPPAAAPAPEESKPKARPKAKAPPKSERWSQAIRFETKSLVEGPFNDRQPTPSSDGKRLAFRRGRGTIMSMDLATKEVHTVAEGWSPDTELRWSPDGRWFAYTMTDRDFNSDIFVVPADHSAPAVNVTRHPDNDHSPRWSADGRILAFVSERTNEEQDVWCVFLDKSLDGMAKFELEKYFKDATETVKKRKPLGASSAKDSSTETADKTETAEKPEKSEKAEMDDAPATAPTLALGDAYRRVRRVTQLPGNEGNLQIAPAGDKLYFTGIGTGTDPSDGGLFVIGWDGTGQKKLGPRVSVQGITLTGDKLITLSSGKGQLTPTTGGGSTASSGDGSSKSDTSNTIEVDASIAVDRAALVEEKFAEAVRLMGENFYHPSMKGLDWESLGARYGELATHARTASEFDHVANRLLGELNASHLGIRSPATPGRTVLPQGRIGVEVSSTPTGLRIDKITPESPAAIAKTALREGDVITAVDFTPILPSDTLSSRMEGTLGREVVFSVERATPDRGVLSFETAIIPVSDGAISRLGYRATQERNARLVDEWSGGRLGYVHIEGMGQESLDEFERDLYAACDGKEGLVIDVRNNGGGWTADRLLASICAPVHAYTVPRGSDPTHHDGYPQDRLFIQRFAGPVNMLCNEKSFSNAEIVAHAFKTLRRGTLVGMPTYGGVISTGSASLLDGTTIRMPTRGWYLPDGTDMELHGAVPDILVEQTPQDEASSNDRQLRAAVENLVGTLGPKPVAAAR
ncbi:MAG: peptidase S41 [Phycisphaerales bacterium]|nr:peptidase S41 [Phycisphaerales bacterium]